MTSLVQKGVWLALVTALISGVSVYINSFGVRQVSDPFVFTAAKNLLVGLALASLLLAPAAWKELRGLSRRQWVSLVALGLVGGSVPFLLFFYALSQATAPSAAFIHKTLFIWVAILAVPFLKERLGKLQIAALGILVVGNLVLIGRPASWALGPAEVFALLATLLWAVEAIVAKKVMGDVSARVAALGRMGFGSVAMLGFLALSSRGDTLATMTGIQWGWVGLTSVFLLGYVTSYYGALKYAPATLVSSVLVLGSVVTSLLYAVFSARTYSVEQIAGFGLVVAAAAIWLYIGNRVAKPAALAQEAYSAGR
jgi:drug/metabolite transporter (DMT)-like permease